MADNVQLSSNIGTGAKAVAFEVDFSGDTDVQLQGVGLFGVSGTPETWTTAPINGDATNGLDVDVTRLPAGTNKIGDVGLGTRTTGGPTSYRNIDCGTTGAVVKGSAGQLYWLHVTNTRTTPVYLKLYNKATAPVAGDTTLLVHTFVVPSAGSTNGAGFVLPLPLGMPFAAGISFRVTTGIADGDTGAPGTNEVVLNCGYA